tara:strand:- start:7417 stop:7659 length:243 start_codon:yes stop_codon:yes gene_type:complete
MNKVTFDEPVYSAPRSVVRKTYQDILIRYGIAKNREQATYILIGVIVLGIIFSFIMIKKGGAGYDNIEGNDTFVPAEITP